MKYLENLNAGWWRNHEEHKRHYIDWLIIFRQLQKENERLGFNDLAVRDKRNAEECKRKLQRVLSGNI